MDLQKKKQFIFLELFSKTVFSLRSFLFLRVYLFLERGEGKEKERERNMDQLPLIRTLAGDRSRNPGMCPDQELNRRHFTLPVGAQPIEPHGLGTKNFLSISSP